MKSFPLILLIVLVPVCAQNYEPLKAEERVKWFGASTFGVRSLLVTGPVSAGWRTLRNSPEEWGPHWEGFGKRYGSRLVNNSVTNGLEASFGAVWKEDPRYFPVGQGAVGARLKQVVRQTWMSRYGNGEYHFGAAKALGIAGGSFMQKTWMPDSVTSNSDCVIRIGTGYAGRLMGNFFREFSPDLLKRFKRK